MKYSKKELKNCFQYSDDQDKLKKVLENTDITIREIGPCKSPLGDDNECTRGKDMFELSVNIKKDEEEYTFPFYTSISDCEILTGKVIKTIYKGKWFFNSVLSRDGFIKKLKRLSCKISEVNTFVKNRDNVKVKEIGSDIKKHLESVGGECRFIYQYSDWIELEHIEYYTGKELAKKKQKVREGFLYSILSCIRSDFYYPDTFKEFCSDFGYDTDSIRVNNIFSKLSVRSTELQCLFNDYEIESFPS